MQFGSILLTTKDKFNLEILANYFSWENFNFSPNNPDILYLNGEGSTSISISEIKRFIDLANKKPFEHNQKLAVIWPAELMTPQAQNSILKTLEEPLANTQIVLVTKNPKQLLVTVRSRLVDLGLVEQSGVVSLHEGYVELAKEFIFAPPLERREIATKKLANFSRPELESFISHLLKFYRDNYQQFASKILENGSLEICLLAKQALNRGVNTKLIIENLLYI